MHPLRASALAICVTAFGGTVALSAQGSGPVLSYTLFERYLDSLRQQTGIPGLSAAIVSGGRVEWERGFGSQDVERNLPATADTPYPVGALTQTFAAVLLGLCAEQGTLNIDEAVSRWVTDFAAPSATVRHVLAHASQGVPPGTFEYDPARYAALTSVSQGCTGQPFRPRVAEGILDRLGMTGSVPGQDLATPGNAFRELFEPADLARYESVIARVALPYRVDRQLRATRSDYQPRGLTAADGLVSTVRDLARFDRALDDGILLRPESLSVAWTPANFTGTPLPTGLGWFVQGYQNERIIWHFSHIPGAYSALIMKMPARQLTLILLANSDGLSTGANLEQGDVMGSPFVKIFLRLFG